LHADHDHETGKRRALLCRRCNMAVGHIETNTKIGLLRAEAMLEKSEPLVRAAVEYLEGFRLK
jgi:hypothetical protein